MVFKFKFTVYHWHERFVSVTAQEPVGFKESVNIATVGAWRLRNIRQSIGDCDIGVDT